MGEMREQSEKKAQACERNAESADHALSPQSSFREAECICGAPYAESQGVCLMEVAEDEVTDEWRPVWESLQSTTRPGSPAGDADA